MQNILNILILVKNICCVIGFLLGTILAVKTKDKKYVFVAVVSLILLVPLAPTGPILFYKN